MSMLPPPSLAPRLNLHKCMKMCLIHDMAESLVGDLTPADRVPKAEKNQREATTMDYITKQVLGNAYGTPSAGEAIREIWQEHEDGETLESRYVQDIDKVELLLQMIEYEKRGEGKIDLSEFSYVATKVRLPEMQSWAQEILQERDRFWSEKNLAHGTGDSTSFQTKELQDQYYGLAHSHTQPL